MGRPSETETRHAPRLLLLWIGPKHSGKTTAALRLAQAARTHGFVVGGFLAPALYEGERLVGFELLDLQNGARAPLAQRRGPAESPEGRFHFLPAALRLGADVLEGTAHARADLAIVDEYGPLELAHQGWRDAVDSLIATFSAPLLLVVRQELAYEVRQLYEGVPSVMLPADEPQSIDKVIQILQTIRIARRSRFRELRRVQSVPLEVKANNSRPMEAIEREDP